MATANSNTGSNTKKRGKSTESSRVTKQELEAARTAIDARLAAARAGEQPAPEKPKRTRSEIYSEAGNPLVTNGGLLLDALGNMEAYACFLQDYFVHAEEDSEPGNTLSMGRFLAIGVLQDAISRLALAEANCESEGV